MGDNNNVLKDDVIERVQLFINETLPTFRNHIAEGVHTIMHLQDIINNLIAMNEDTANPVEWNLEQSSYSDSGGQASSSTGPDEV